MSVLSGQCPGMHLGDAGSLEPSLRSPQTPSEIANT